MKEPDTSPEAVARLAAGTRGTTAWFDDSFSTMNAYPQQTIYPGKVVIGSCSLCGGPVLVHENWFCTIPDVPTCGHCGATKADTHGPVIPMVPTLPRQPDISLTTDSSNASGETRGPNT